MSLLLDKNLIIVTSALKPNIGVVSHEDRFTQTMDSLISLRKHLPNDYIFFTDGSPNPIEKDKLDKISKLANIVACWDHDADIKTLASNGQKSQSEIVLLIKTLSAIQQNQDLQHMMQPVKRIFKFSARSTLHDTFDIKEYNNTFGKYVFKKRIPSWLPAQHPVDHLFITRMYSLCPSLMQNYFEVLINAYNTVNDTGIDTEHAHYKHIDKQYLIEFDKLHCEGIMAGTGETETY